MQRFDIEHGKVVDFSLVLRMKIDDTWHNVKRWDAWDGHGGVPHCHIFTLSGGHRREVIGEATGDFGDLIGEVIRDTKSHLDAILDNFRHSS